MLSLSGPAYESRLLLLGVPAAGWSSLWGGVGGLPHDLGIDLCCIEELRESAGVLFFSEAKVEVDGALDSRVHPPGPDPLGRPLL